MILRLICGHNDSGTVVRTASMTRLVFAMTSARPIRLSALVWHKDSPDLGKGFYDYARKLGMLNGRTQEAKDIFLVQQLRDIADYCNRIS